MYLLRVMAACLLLLYLATTAGCKRQGVTFDTHVAAGNLLGLSPGEINCVQGRTLIYCQERQPPYRAVTCDSDDRCIFGSHMEAR